MAELHKTVSIAASPDDVWAVLGDLAATSEWIPGTVATRIHGSVRICETADGGEVHEEIADYSAERRTYAFRHVRIPLPVENSRGTFTVEPGDAGGAVVVLDAAFDALDPTMEPEIERMFGGALDETLECLRRRVEEGVSWQSAA